MKTGAYKLLVTDLDGTLLDDHSRIPDGTREAIAKAAARGVPTVISSGRSYMSLRYFEEQLGLLREGCYGICFNGGIVYQAHDRKKLLEQRLCRDIAMGILDGLRAFPVDIMVYLDTELLAEKGSFEVFSYSDRSSIPVTMVRDFAEIQEDFSKILLKGSHALLTQVAAHMGPKANGRYNMFFSSETLLEFCGLSVDKGSGLAFLLGHMGIEPSACIAVGDQHNDVPMLLTAGLGIAVQNAVPAVQQAAGHITRATNNEGAIQEIIETFIL